VKNTDRNKSLATRSRLYVLRERQGWEIKERTIKTEGNWGTAGVSLALLSGGTKTMEGPRNLTGVETQNGDMKYRKGGGMIRTWGENNIYPWRLPWKK